MDITDFDITNIVEQAEKESKEKEGNVTISEPKPKENMLLSLATSPMAMGMAKRLPLKVKVIIGLALVLIIVGIVTVFNWIFEFIVAFPMPSSIIASVILLGVVAMDIVARIKKKKKLKKTKELIDAIDVVQENIPTMQPSEMLRVVKEVKKHTEE